MPIPMPLPQFLPADVIAFEGRGLQSRAIQIATCSAGQWWRGERISHVEICSLTGAEMLLYGSTTEPLPPCAIQHKKVIGAQAHRPRERIANYDGRAWLLRLAAREKLSWQETAKLDDFLRGTLGLPYDNLGATFAGSHWTKRWLAREGWLHMDLSAAFCDEWVAAALMDIGKLPRFNGSIVTPAWLVWHLVDIGLYRPLELIKDR